MAAHAHDPKLFTTAPVGAIQKVLGKALWTIDDVDLFEVNEAFACVAMFAMHDLGIPHDKININGGARLWATLLALAEHGLSSPC